MNRGFSGPSWRPIGLPVWSNSAFHTHRLPRHTGPLRGLSLCKPFILFQTVCPQPSTIQFAHSTVPSSDHWRKAMCEPVWYTKHPKPDRPAQMYTQVLFKPCIVLRACVRARMPVYYLLVELPCMWMMHFASMFISLELKGRTRTATFTEAPDMVAVLDSFPVRIPVYPSYIKTSIK